MGTNFYLKARGPCAACGRGAEGRGLHIGKRSAGWVFALHIPTDAECATAGVPIITSLDDWLPLFARFGVVDEYGRDLTPAEMTEIISGNIGRKHAAGDHVIASRETYDLIAGEFS